MTQGGDPSRSQPGIGERLPRQPTGEADARPDLAQALGAQGIQGTREEELHRQHTNAEANQRLVIGVINNLPRVEEVDEWSDRLNISALLAGGGEPQAKALIGMTVWKQDTVREGNGKLALRPPGHPRWLIGRRIRGATSDLLLAERDKNNNVRVFVVRVATAAYDMVRNEAQAELEPAYTRAQYGGIYDRRRRVLRITGELPGVVRIRWSEDGELQPGKEDREYRRLPAVHVGDVEIFSDWLMTTFGVGERLRDVALALGLERRYRELEARHVGQRRPPTGMHATE